MSQPQVIASIGSRFMAVIIDSIIVGILSFMVSYLFNTFVSLPPDKMKQAQTIVSIGMMLFSSILYYPIFTIYGGATPGKMALSIKVIDKDGEDIGPLQAILREAIYKTISIIVFGFAWAFFNEKNRTFWDYTSGSIVVKS